MANTTTDASTPGAAAVTEAARITAEASRKTAESARASVEVARTYLDESVAANKQLFSAFATGGEAALKAGFEIQNAAIQAGLSVYDTVVKANRSFLDELVSAASQTQRAALEGWQAGVRAGDRAFQKST